MRLVAAALVALSACGPPEAGADPSATTPDARRPSPSSPADPAEIVEPHTIDEPPRPPLPRAPSPRLDEVIQIGTHNAYWIDRRIDGDLFGSGVGERLLDQLAYDRVRAVELDLHRDRARPGEFRVYHTRAGNSLCDDLRGCLAELRAFAWATPRHEPITVILELKEIFSGNWDGEHRPEDLDRLLRDALGPALFSPAALLDRCPGDRTLDACVRRAGWPGLAELRGRVIVTLLGNWDELGAQATVDWITYSKGPIRERAAFPMASSWKLDASRLPPTIAGRVSQAEIDRALADTVFLQVEEVEDPRLAPFLARGGIVRLGGADGIAAQEARIAAGAQILQTDTPWIRARDPGARASVTPRDPTLAAPEEPGARLFLDAGPDEAVSAARIGEGPFVLAALVASGPSRALGCLQAAAEVGVDADRIELCRRVLGPGVDAGRVVVVARTCAGGACESIEVRSHDPESTGVGDLLALVGDARGCVQPRSARILGADGEPAWIDVGEPLCPAVPLRLRGLYLPASAEPRRVGYFGVDAEGFVVNVHGRDGVTVEPTRLVDASVR